MQLISTNIGGNLHNASNALNKMGLADFVIAMDFSGSSTVVVLRVPSDIAPKIREHLGVLPEYCPNPKPEKIWSTSTGRQARAKA